MKQNDLKIIDFTTGIRAEDIEHNFNVLDERLNRERRNVGGPGIASGLDVKINASLDEFNITISEASIIANDGKEIFIPTTTLEIERPKLIKEKEYLNSDYHNQVFLKYNPYANNRKYPAEFLDSYLEKDSAINIKYQNSNNANDGIRIASIMKNVLSLTRLTRRDLEITYSYTAKRIDTIYIDENYEIKILQGTTSTTPSAILPNKFKYLIAFIEIDPYYTDKSGNSYATILIRKDLRELRNIYTDNNGRLWICGTPFDSLQIVHMSEPSNPTENALWYDKYSNQLKIWRATDELKYINKVTVTTDFEMYPNLQKDFTTDILYQVGGKQLSVYVNDRKLTLNKEYVELTVLMLPVDEADIQLGLYSKSFRITSDLKVNDVITYKIEAFDKHNMWVPVNSTSFINTKEVKMFGPGESNKENYFMTAGALAMGLDTNKYPYKYQYFFFDYNTEKHLMFTPGLKELDININQIDLYYDQFEEITLMDLYDSKLPENVANAAREHYGYTYDITSTIHGEYENTGIGFKLVEPLDVGMGEEINAPNDLYVQATVTRRVNDAPLKRKLQRTATFVACNEISYITEFDAESHETISSIPEDEDGNYVVDIEESYRFGENQLEVYINGIRLSSANIIEGSELSDEPMYAIPGDEASGIIQDAPRSMGALTRQFKIKDKKLTYGDVVTYRITTNFYTYDHINQLIDDLDYNAKAAIEKVDAVYEKTVAIQNEVDEKISVLDEEIQSIKDISNNLDERYLEKDDVITEGQMPPWMVTNAIKTLDHNNTGVITYWADNDEFDVSSFVKEQDFVIAIRRANQNQMDRFLIRGYDYHIIDTMSDGNYKKTILTFTEEGKSNLETYDKIILTGIKLSNLWRR